MTFLERLTLCIVLGAAFVGGCFQVRAGLQALALQDVNSINRQYEIFQEQAKDQLQRLRPND